MFLICFTGMLLLLLLLLMEVLVLLALLFLCQAAFGFGSVGRTSALFRFPTTLLTHQDTKHTMMGEVARGRRQMSYV